jgi:excisionase family DNA binding protein
VSSLNPVDDGDLSELRLLTVGEVAERVRLSRMSVYRLVRSGQLSSLRIGRAYRIPRAALTLFLQNCSSETHPDSGTTPTAR